MHDFLTSPGLTLTSNWGIFWVCTAWTFLAITTIWVIGLFQGNHSMVDGYYGFGFAVPLWIAYILTGAASPTAGALLIMVSLHGCRLGYYLSRRWLGYRKTTGGDARYLGFVKQYQPGYWWKSLCIIMEPQAFIITLIGLPAIWGVLDNRTPAGPLTPLSFLGLLIFGIGYYFETVADGQLQAFKADAHNKGRYLRTGVWTHTRHPNYFGNTCVWWGVWLVAVAGNHTLWWTVAGPIWNTIMLTKVLGRAFQDRHMGVRPEYQKVIAETSSFLPIPKQRT
jgi:steroid 5-alpha reductase family enzyme